MPDSAPVVPVAPAPEGTTLWNIQTQSPEWVPLPQVRDRLASGSHRTYAGSDVAVTAGIGGEAVLSPDKAAIAVAGGATPTHSEAARDARAREQSIERAYDNAGDKALAVVDGLVSGLSGGLLEGLPGGGLSAIEREKRQEYHPGYNTLGELSALAATILAPESALKYTPLGGSNTLLSKAAGATEKALSAKVGSSVVRKGISEAVGGAVAAGALSSAHAVGQAVQGKPVSGYAILDDVGLGAAIGLGLGSVGEALAGRARKTADAAKQIQAAARFDESAAPIRGQLTEVSKTWDTAHNIATARYNNLNKLVESGMLDAEMPGTEWLAARTEAKAAADKARAKLIKAAGTDDASAIGERLHDVAVSGKVKDAQKLYQAFDDYGTAVSRFDDAMQPTTFDTAHLGDVVGDIDMVIPARDHPLQRLEQMIENGSPTDEIERFANEIDTNYQKAIKPVNPVAERETVQVKQGALAKGTPVVHEIDASEVAVRTPEPEVISSKGTPGGIKVSNIEPPQYPKPKPRVLADDINPQLASDDEIKSTLLGGGRAPNEEAGLNAKYILASGVMNPVRPTDLGNKIQGILDRLTADTGNRLGSVEARALANKLGMNTATLSGPVASKLADLWSLHRMSETLADQLGTKAKQGKTVLTKALSWGVVSGAGHVGYQAGGPMAAGAVRSLARQALGTALYGAAAVSAAAGRFRQSAINGITKALAPTGRRAIGLAAIDKVVSSSYEPKKAPTTDFDTKANQLRWLAQNPDPTETHLKEVFKDIGGVDPMAYTATVNAAMTRLKNLEKALPTSAAVTIMAKHKGPTDAQIQEWHQYEAVTADKELVFKYLKAGYMPPSVVSAMNEQHPDYMQEIRDYVLNNPDAVQSASHDTQMALSALLGVPLVPEADPNYVRRMQEPYTEAKQKAEQAKMQAQGAQAIHPPQPTPAQLLVISR